jgi:hypothetical protein
MNDYKLIHNALKPKKLIYQLVVKYNLSGEGLKYILLGAVLSFGTVSIDAKADLILIGAYGVF